MPDDGAEALSNDLLDLLKAYLTQGARSPERVHAVLDVLADAAGVCITGAPTEFQVALCDRFSLALCKALAEFGDGEPVEAVELDLPPSAVRH